MFTASGRSISGYIFDHCIKMIKYRNDFLLSQEQKIENVPFIGHEYLKCEENFFEAMQPVSFLTIEFLYIYF